VRVAEAEQIPVTAAWRRPDVFPNDHPLFLGHGGLGAPRAIVNRLLDADVILTVGSRLNEMTSQGYRVPGADTRMIHVDLWAEGLGGHRPADVPIQSDAALFAEALLDAIAKQPASADLINLRRERNAVDRAAYDAQSTPQRGRARAGYLDQQAIAAQMRCVLPAEAVVTTEAGNFGGWPRLLRWRLPGTFLGPTSGAMGYSAPPPSPPPPGDPCGGVTLVGDGFLMAARSPAPSVNRSDCRAVYDNGQYTPFACTRARARSTHRHRARAVDFAALARSLGADGITPRDQEVRPHH
jgi:acetolactate synthase-1/2/3 large subunit